MKKEKWEKRDEAMRRPLDDLQLEASLNFFFFSFFFLIKRNLPIIFNEQLHKNNLWIILYNYE